MSPIVILGGAVLLLLVVVLIFVGIRMPQAKDPIQERLAEFSMRDVPMSLEEIEMSLGLLVICNIHCHAHFCGQAAGTQKNNEKVQPGCPVQISHRGRKAIGLSTGSGKLFPTVHGSICAPG